MRLNSEKSLKTKLLIYFMLFAALLIALIWGLQSLFLSQYYQNMKFQKTKQVAEKIERTYKKGNYNEFLRSLVTLAPKHDLFIYIIPAEGNPLIFTPYSQEGLDLAGQKYLDELLKETSSVREAMRNAKTGTISKILSENDGVNTLIYGSFLETSEFGSTEMFIFTPLYPMNSTIRILSTQMAIVTIISLLLVSLLATLFARKISKPLQTISVSAAKLGRGDYKIQFPKSGYKELNDLSEILNQMAKDLESTDKLKRDILANIGHDLRTPLTMIRSYGEMIRDISGEDDKKRNKHLQVIIDESERLNKLVDDILILSKIQSGVDVLNKEILDLRTIVISVINSFEIYRHDMGCSFLLISPEPINVAVDEKRIRQVLMNIIINAVNHSPKNSQIIVSLTKHNKKALCQIADCGPGIPENELANIWSRYYKAANNLVRSSQGSGLGLAIVKEIVEKHDGEVGVVSVENSGSVFWFSLPL